MGLFAIFGLASVIAYSFINKSDTLYGMLAEERLEIKADVDDANAELLAPKELDGGAKQVAPEEVFDILKSDLISAPAKSAMALPGMAVADSAQIEAGKGLFAAKGCVACHGADAKTSIAPIYPSLAGKEYDYLVQQMQDIKSGKRVSPLTPTMMPFISQCSDEEIEALGAWLATVK